jgi:putative methyltransferase (TIGR04325 family)
MKKSRLKDWLPPRFVKSIKQSGLVNTGLYWKGNYANWEEALEKSTGYDSLEIVERVKTALLAVKNGEAAYERDSVLFDTIEYDWPVLSSLLWISSINGKLHVMDFGGSLGSTYYQNLQFLNRIKEVSWNVVEQANFVACGKENFQDDRIRFYNTVEECFQENKINIVVLSSVLPYLKDPYGLMEQLLPLPVDYLLIDKMPLIQSAVDRITVQQVPAPIYKASYPAWFFSAAKFYGFVDKHFQIVTEFDRDIVANIPSVFKGMLLAKRTTK